MNLRFSQLFGKYRDLLLAIALFVVIDLAVLIFNAQSSRLLESDAGRINRAGDLRVYSQQLAKAILSLRHEFQGGVPTQTSLAQIRESFAAHKQSLDDLREDLRQPGRRFLQDGEGAERAGFLLGELEKIWTPLAETVRPLLDERGVTEENIEIAANRVVARNLRLMQQAEDLTQHLEQMAVHRAGQMRLIQLAAIALALLNFVFIVFKFLRTLARSDQRADEARQETERILGTVREGLFLLHKDGTVGGQQSAWTATLLGHALSPGENFFDELQRRMPPEAAEAAKNYIGVLFSERVKPALLKQLNPLREVAFEMADATIRYLDFEFQQVLSGGRIEALLVSVSDISEKVRLARELEDARAQGKSDVDALLALLEQDPAAVSAFVGSATKRLLEINRMLESLEASPQAYRRLVDETGRVVHGIKGEAGMLGLESVEAAIHHFEDVLAPLRRAKNLSGDNLIPVAVAMNDLLEHLENVRRIIARLVRFAEGLQASEPPVLETMIGEVEQLVRRVAGDLHKKVRLETRCEERPDMHRLVDVLREVVPQLVRNAVTHGIEPVEERVQAGKDAEGVIRVALETQTDGHLVLSVEDDGRGLDPHRLRRCLIERSLRSAEEVAGMSDQDVVAMIFSPGFSSLDAAHRHGGRGDGLAVVKAFAERLGMRLQISSRPLQFTRFSLVMKVPS